MKLARLIVGWILLWSMAWPAVAADLPADGYNVLCYHNVLDDPLQDPEKYTVSTAALVQQFSWLKENGYQVISVDQLLAARAGGKPLPHKAVMLSFDDGYRSFYTHVYPLLKQFNYPAVLAIVGAWPHMKPGEKVPYEGHNYTRESFATDDELREMARSGLVELASHGYDLHQGILANPQGNLLPAAVSRLYNPQDKTYESDQDYLSRISSDLKANSDYIGQLAGRKPRVMVWPFGRYNDVLLEVAHSLGMSLTFTLEDGANSVKEPSGQVKRVLVAHNTSIADLAEDLAGTVRPKPERVMHVDIDYIYDADPVQQEKNLGKLLDRVKAMKITTVYLQAFADPDANGAADRMYFPNRHLPVRADLFSRVSWQLKTRTEVKVYAWMPLLAFELPASHPLANHRVKSAPGGDAKGGYLRLSPFDSEVRQVITEIYEDLAKNAIFDGVLFHDDATLSDYEDTSSWALDYYRNQWGMPKSVAEIRSQPELFRRWTEEKTRFLTDFSLTLAKTVRQSQPNLKTARNIYAEVILHPNSEEWYAQSLPNFLQNYDYTAVMAMPFMENATQPMVWLKKLVQEVAKQPRALDRTVFELQAKDWHDSEPVDSRVLASQMKLLKQQGVRNFGYYPDDFLNDQPSFKVIQPVFSLQDFPYTGKTE
ncbi:MAG TPA: poly-beta-1,6-N-acetyl-D-glucosamine N-deacetylase PgaB [Gallionella sp.]|nr:poly-beta-1,6-N-acetyl-D-glucosamine N-deacetylase PgaB [Gallionella sp.]